MHETILSARSRRGSNYWRELWNARELLFFLAWRDVLVRYKQAGLGIAWAVLRPLLTTLVFTLVFGKIARLPSGEVPYSLLVLSGLTPWLFFATTLNESGNSLVSNSALVTKVYFPRLVVPLSAVLTNMVDLAISFSMLCVMLLWFGVDVGWQIVLVPVIFALLVMFTVGAALWVSALNARYRDLSFVLPFFVTFGLYLSPIGFSSSTIPEKWRTLYGLNPIVGVVDGFRFALFGEQYSFQPWTLAYSFILALALIVTGFHYFRSVEHDLVDIL